MTKLIKTTECEHDLEKVTEPVVADNEEYQGPQMYMTFMKCKKCPYKRAVDYGDTK